MTTYSRQQQQDLKNCTTDEVFNELMPTIDTSEHLLECVSHFSSTMKDYFNKYSSKRYDFETIDSEGRNIFHVMAIANINLECIKNVAAYEYHGNEYKKLRVLDNYGMNPLNYARNCDVANVFLSHGSNGVNSKTNPDQVFGSLFSDMKANPLFERVTSKYPSLIKQDYKADEFNSNEFIKIIRNERLLKFLLDTNMDVNYVDSNGCNALFFVCDNHVDIITSLINDGINVTRKNNKGETALYRYLNTDGCNVCHLVCNGRVDIDTLIEVTHDNDERETALYHCAGNNLDINLQVVELLSASPENINYNGNNKGDTVLHTLIKRLNPGHVDGDKIVEAVFRLVSLGSDINVRNHKGQTCLHKLLRSVDIFGLQDDVQPLIDNIKKVLVDGQVDKGVIELIEWELKRAKFGHNYVCYQDMYDEQVVTLLKWGLHSNLFLINAVDNNGNTLLHVIIKALIDEGKESVERLEEYSQIATLKYACYHFQDKLIEIVKAHLNEYETRLYSNAIKVIKLLTVEGSDIYVKDNEGNSVSKLWFKNQGSAWFERVRGLLVNDGEC